MAVPLSLQWQTARDGPGSYAVLSLAEACKAARDFLARVALGHDVAGEKQEVKRVAVARIEGKKNARLRRFSARSISRLPRLSCATLHCLAP